LDTTPPPASWLRIRVIADFEAMSGRTATQRARKVGK
jgi:hypothetical protein